MKTVNLSTIKDGKLLKLSARGIAYKRIAEMPKIGIVITSTKSENSRILKGKTKVISL